MAHVALTDDAETLVVFRHVVRAFQHAILAANALVVQMLDDAGARILLVGEHGAAGHARRIGAMVAGGGDGLLIGCGGCAADEKADVAPGFVFVETVE